MNGWILGALLGAIAAAGVLIAVFSTPPMRRIRLADRIAPYVAEAPVPSRLLHKPSGMSTPLVVGRRLLGPAVSDAVRMADRLLGGTESVRRRLGGLGDPVTVEEFRIEQVLWGAAATAGSAALLSLVTWAHGGVNPLLVIAGALVAGVAGVLGRDWWLGQQVQRRERAMLAEFPVVADLLALAVLAGEAPINAMQRVCRLTDGELTRDLDSALAVARAGGSITSALSDLAVRTTLEPFGRFVEGLVVAIERGTPLAEVLRAQAADVREGSKRALLEAGGRKELQMMVPVVFMILPVTVLFALYPGLITLISITQ